MVEGHRLLLLGHPDPTTLASSAWAWSQGERGGRLPTLDLQHHTRVADAVRSLVAAGVPSGVHDVSSGGLGLALAEMAVRSSVGFWVEGLDGPSALLSEAPSRVVVCVAPDRMGEVVAAAAEAAVPCAEVGDAGGDRLVVEGLVDLG